MAMKSSEQQSIENTEGFFRILGAFENLPETVEKKGSYTDLIRSNLKVQRVDAGRVTCILIVGPAILNLYGTLHGGAVTAVAEEVTLACVRTVVGDKRFFLGEASTSYLSSASLNAEVEVDGRIVRQGRSVIVSSVEFRTKETGKLLYTFRATFYKMPVASI